MGVMYVSTQGCSIIPRRGLQYLNKAFDPHVSIIRLQVYYEHLSVHRSNLLDGTHITWILRVFLWVVGEGGINDFLWKVRS